MKRILQVVLFAVIITGCETGENGDNLTASEEIKLDIKKMEEQWILEPNESEPNQIISELNPMWSSTAFWYSATATGAESMQ